LFVLSSCRVTIKTCDLLDGFLSSATNEFRLIVLRNPLQEWQRLRVSDISECPHRRPEHLEVWYSQCINEWSDSITAASRVDFPPRARYNGAMLEWRKRMASKSPFTWKPQDIIFVTNISAENILLELESGLLRLDSGRKLRLTASALEQPQLVALTNAGKLKVEPTRRR
jgi:hypothetical protein